MRLLSNEEIYNLYQKHIIKDSAYFERFELLSSTLTDEDRTYWKGRDACRFISICDFKEWIVKHNIQHGEGLLCTCDEDPEIKYLDYRMTTVASYPAHDLHTLSLDKKNYNLVVFNQTLEHLYDPFVAITRLFEHLKPGGHLYTSVPTVCIPHLMPFHFWGITPIGLCAIMTSCGFEICECGFWGNFKYMEYMFNKHWWPDHLEVAEDGKITYNPVCQAQVWVLAKKPGR